jgi:hypothetical protein
MDKATRQTLFGTEKLFQGEISRAVGVRGWSSENCSEDQSPAVIVNPDATPLSLLSWGVDQLQQCNALLNMLGDVEQTSTSMSRLADSALHFLLQAETVLHAGIEMLVAQQLMNDPASE